MQRPLSQFRSLEVAGELPPDESEKAKPKKRFDNGPESSPFAAHAAIVAEPIAAVPALTGSGRLPGPVPIGAGNECSRRLQFRLIREQVGVDGIICTRGKTRGVVSALFCAHAK